MTGDDALHADEESLLQLTDEQCRRVVDLVGARVFDHDRTALTAAYSDLRRSLDTLAVDLEVAAATEAGSRREESGLR